jgi:acyl carrier protein
MASQDIFDKVAEVICKEFNYPREKLLPTSTARMVPHWDSLSHTVVLIKVEDVFGIELPDDEVFRLQNVGELADLVERVLNDQ